MDERPMRVGGDVAFVRGGRSGGIRTATLRLKADATSGRATPDKLARSRRARWPEPPCIAPNPVQQPRVIGISHLDRLDHVFGQFQP